MTKPNRRELLRQAAVAPTVGLAAAMANVAPVPSESAAADFRDLPQNEWRRHGPWWILWTGYRYEANSLNVSGFWVAVPGIPGEERKWDETKAAVYVGINGVYSTFGRGYVLNTDGQNQFLDVSDWSSQEKMAWMRDMARRSLLALIADGVIEKDPYDQREAIAHDRRRKLPEDLRAFLGLRAHLEHRLGNGWDRLPFDEIIAEVRRVFGKYAEMT